MSVMSAIIIIINAGCIFIINWSPVLRRKTASIFVYSILTLHLLQGSFVIPFYAAKKTPGVDSVVMRKFICDGFRLSYMVTFYGACVNVLLIGGDRLLAVILMTSYKSVVTRRRAIIAVCSLWTYVFLLCMVPFIPDEEGKFCRYNQQDEWTIFMLFFNTLIPYIFVTVSYLFVTIKLDRLQRKTHRTTPHVTNNNNSSNNLQTNASPMKNNTMDTLSVNGDQSEVSEDGRRKSRATSTFHLFTLHKSKENKEADREKTKDIRKVTKLTFIIILAYGLTWAPSIIYYILLKVAPSIFTEEYNTSAAESYVTFFIKFITFFDALFTPVIYCYFHNDFRREFNKFWERLFNSHRDVMEIKDETTATSRPRSCTSW